jgi:hypothetical protein
LHALGNFYILLWGIMENPSVKEAGALFIAVGTVMVLKNVSAHLARGVEHQPLVVSLLLGQGIGFERAHVLAEQVPTSVLLSVV